MSKSGISVIIPTWNGKALLDECLPALFDALDFWGGNSEVIVADDGGTDGISEYLASKYPRARCVRLHRRRGFVHTANLGMRAASLEFIFLLNNDMIVEKEIFAPLVECMSDPAVFAVSARATQRDTGALNLGRRIRRLENNIIAGIGEETDDPETGYTFYASGGASLFRRELVEKLGWLDEMYAPFYVEDADLGYRAWKRGYMILHEPRARARHIGGASIGMKNAPFLKRAFNKIRVMTIIHRNATLFNIKNITEPVVRSAYRMHYLRRAASAVARLNVTFLLGLIATLPRLGKAFNGYRNELSECTVTESSYIEKLNTKYIRAKECEQP